LRPFLPALITAIGHDPNVQSLELAYSRVALLTVGPTTAGVGLGWFFVGIHRPWVTMWSVIEANVVNVLVSLVLIFGYLGFEPMGIAGAAWGTLAGVSYRTLRLTLVLVGPSMHRVYASRSTWRPSWSKLRRLLRTGMPCGLHWVSEVVVWAIFVTVLIGSKFGTAHLVATNTAWQYLRLAFMPTIGVGQAITALVGKSIGAGNPQRAVREVRYGVLITLAYMGTLAFIYGFLGRELISLFNSEPEVVRIGGSIMICAAIFQLFDALGIIYNSALRGAGDTFVPSVFFIVSNWVIIVGGGWWVASTYPELGSLGPWIVASGLIVITGIFLWWRWHQRAWMKIDLFGSARPQPEDEDVPAEQVLASAPER
jgi:MATE family multidrug resistance protein